MSYNIHAVNNSTNYNTSHQFGNSVLRQPYQLMLFQYVYQYIEKKEVYQVNKIELRDHLESFYIMLEYEVEEI